MTSSVFFKFKSQREPTRVEFDGTGISVFELKREIIIKSGLGDGSDFDLHIYTDDNSEGKFTSQAQHTRALLITAQNMMTTPPLFPDQQRSSLGVSQPSSKARGGLPVMYPARCLQRPRMLVAKSKQQRPRHQSLVLTQSTK